MHIPFSKPYTIPTGQFFSQLDHFGDFHSKTQNSIRSTEYYPLTTDDDRHLPYREPHRKKIKKQNKSHTKKNLNRQHIPLHPTNKIPFWHHFTTFLPFWIFRQFNHTLRTDRRREKYTVRNVGEISKCVGDRRCTFKFRFHFSKNLQGDCSNVKVRENSKI